MRESIRAELVRLTGGPREAFQTFDLNRSGGVSLMEFADGIARLGLNFMELTGLQKQQSLFRLFDVDKDGVITFAELFPEEAARKAELPEDAEEFVSFWFRQNRDFRQPYAGPRWEPSGADEELQDTLDASQYAADVAAKKKWMSSTIRRLKKRGKSDARCRELVALHLPRGTGPKDLQDVKTFSRTDVRASRKKYTDAWSLPVKKIQKAIVDMREIKWDLRDVRDELYKVTEGRLQRLDEEREARRSLVEDRRSIVSALLGPREAEFLKAAAQPAAPSAAAAAPPAAAPTAAAAEEASALASPDADSDAPSNDDHPDEAAMVAYFRDCLAAHIAGR